MMKGICKFLALPFYTLTGALCQSPKDLTAGQFGVHCIALLYLTLHYVDILC